MSAQTNPPVVQCHGRAATVEELARLAFAGFAHFTAMQVRGGSIRGLDLHLERLRVASMTLFGQAMPDEQVLAHLKTALAASSADVSLTATMYSRTGEFTAAGATAQPDVLIRTGPAASGPAGPLSLAVVEYERVLPAVKHVGEVAKTYYLRKAVEQGFDDAAFVDRRGRLSEASIWNLAFWDGTAVVWPDAEILTGVTMSILRRQLQRLGVPQRVQQIIPADVPKFAGAVVMNSWTPGVALKRIGCESLPDASPFVELLHRAYRNEPLVAP